jgi:hypothetical protein
MATQSSATAKCADQQNVVIDGGIIGGGCVMSSKKVTIDLTGDEALVLYDWLTRFTRRDDMHVTDQAEERVLFDLAAMLEKALITPLQADYAQQLARARARVRDTCT